MKSVEQPLLVARHVWARACQGAYNGAVRGVPNIGTGLLGRLGTAIQSQGDSVALYQAF